MRFAQTDGCRKAVHDSLNSSENVSSIQPSTDREHPSCQSGLYVRSRVEVKAQSITSPAMPTFIFPLQIDKSSRHTPEREMSIRSFRHVAHRCPTRQGPDSSKHLSEPYLSARSTLTRRAVNILGYPVNFQEIHKQTYRANSSSQRYH